MGTKPHYAFRSSATPVGARGEEKRRRLLHAAGEVFAERGFKAATIQEIADRANANIASVNYHFRDKETLYHEVFQDAVSHSLLAFLESHFGDETEQPPAARLGREIHRILKPALHSDSSAWQPVMLLREILDPTTVFDSLMEQNLRPHQAVVESLARALLDADADEHIVRFCAMAVVAICWHFRNLEKFIKRLYPDDHFSSASADELARLVTRFVLGGIAGLREPVA